MTDPARVHGGYAPSPTTVAPPLPQLPADVAVALAAGVDTNPAGAERLRLYWTTGEGGRVKIRWGTEGAYTRCVHLLTEHLGVRAAGYCALRCREATGEYPGQGKDSRPGV
jgi:hypothetical protein